MSYGQPCRSTTGGPSAGPSSAYPTFRTPASICFSGPNDVLVAYLAGSAAVRLIPSDCRSIAPSTDSLAPAIAVTAALRKRRRSLSISSDIDLSPGDQAIFRRRDRRDESAVLLHEGIEARCGAFRKRSSGVYNGRGAR